MEDKPKLQDLKHGDKLYTVIEGRDGPAIDAITCVDVPGFERVYAKASGHPLATKVYELVTVKESLIGTYACPWHFSVQDAVDQWGKAILEQANRKIDAFREKLKPKDPPEVKA